MEGGGGKEAQEVKNKVENEIGKGINGNRRGKKKKENLLKERLIKTQAGSVKRCTSQGKVVSHGLQLRALILFFFP